MKGIAFHCHHSILLDYVHDYQERVDYIKNHKPKDEQELRLRLFKMIPEDRLPKKGLAAYDKAWDAYIKAGDAYDKARDAYNKAWATCVKAGDAYIKARDAYNKAWATYGKGNKTEFEALHKELCPDCPFDKGTIFTRRDIWCRFQASYSKGYRGGGLNNG